VGCYDDRFEEQSTSPLTSRSANEIGHKKANENSPKSYKLDIHIFGHTRHTLRDAPVQDSGRLMQ
jgi:hypothetical protein